MSLNRDVIPTSGINKTHLDKFLKCDGKAKSWTSEHFPSGWRKPKTESRKWHHDIRPVGSTEQNLELPWLHPWNVQWGSVEAIVSLFVSCVVERQQNPCSLLAANTMPWIKDLELAGRINFPNSMGTLPTISCWTKRIYRKGFYPQLFLQIWLRCRRFWHFLLFTLWTSCILIQAVFSTKTGSGFCILGNEASIFNGVTKNPASRKKFCSEQHRNQNENVDHQQCLFRLLEWNTGKHSLIQGHTRAFTCANTEVWTSIFRMTGKP